MLKITPSIIRCNRNILNKKVTFNNVHCRKSTMLAQETLSPEILSRPAIKSIQIDELNNDEIIINWSDGLQSLFPSIYLRDNCLDYKTQNGQRLFETKDLKPEETKINSINADNDIDPKQIDIKWSDESINTFSADWLFENSCNEHHRLQRNKQISSDVTLWDNKSLSTPNIICKYSDIDQYESKINIYQELRKHGVCLLSDAPLKEQYDANNDPPIINVGNTLGFVRQTNYGKYFDVRSVPNKDSINLAYTTKGLSVHTDNPYRNPTPGIQLLHCLKQAKKGENNEGNSVLIDGFKIAQEMREKYPKEFELLSRVKRPFTYYDLNGGYKFHKERYVIGIDERGEIESIHFNNRSASCVNWNIDEKIIKSYYKAWQLFGNLANDTMKEYAIQYRLEPGQILIFNNNRVLHGRNGYIDEICNDDGTGISRHLQGCYIDCDTVWARLDAFQHLEKEKFKKEML